MTLTSTEMDFMERRTQLRNKCIIVFLTSLFLIGCKEAPNFESILATDARLEKERGIFPIDNQPFFGEIIRLFPNEDTMEVATYEKGRKEGQTKKYWSNGRLKFRADYQKGLYHGLVEEWYEDGQQFTSFEYVDGHESGTQKSWKPDGSIKANYEVIGNRQYGLTGSKNCSNDWNQEDK